MKNISLGVAFILEIVAFISFACFGFLFPLGQILQILLSVTLFIILIAYWSLYMAPKAPKKLKAASYYISKLVIYSLAAFVIFNTQSLTLGMLFIFAAVIDEILLFKHNTT